MCNGMNVCVWGGGSYFVLCERGLLVAYMYTLIHSREYKVHVIQCTCIMRYCYSQLCGLLVVQRIHDSSGPLQGVEWWGLPHSCGHSSSPNS